MIVVTFLKTTKYIGFELSHLDTLSTCTNPVVAMAVKNFQVPKFTKMSVILEVLETADAKVARS